MKEEDVINKIKERIYKKDGQRRSIYIEGSSNEDVYLFTNIISYFNSIKGFYAIMSLSIMYGIPTLHVEFQLSKDKEI